MARKKKTTPHTEPKLHGYIAGAGEIVEQKIADTIEENYMPYATVSYTHLTLPTNSLV